MSQEDIETVCGAEFAQAALEYGYFQGGLICSLPEGHDGQHAMPNWGQTMEPMSQEDIETEMRRAIAGYGWGSERLLPAYDALLARRQAAEEERDKLMFRYRENIDLEARIRAAEELVAKMRIWDVTRTNLAWADELDAALSSTQEESHDSGVES